jgi:DNA polymerase-3 subunit delta'
LRDLLLLQCGHAASVRNQDIARELEALAQRAPFFWIERAMQGLDAVETGMRRNLLRSLSLDAMVAGLGTDSSEDSAFSNT